MIIIFVKKSHAEVILKYVRPARKTQPRAGTSSPRTHPAGFEKTPDGPPETPFPPNCSPEFCVRPRRRRRAPVDGGMGPRNPFFFRQRAGAVNWRIVGACDLLKVVKEGDISELQGVLDNIVFSEVHPRSFPTAREDLVAKLICCLQLSCESLLNANDLTEARAADLASSLEALKDTCAKQESGVRQLGMQTQRLQRQLGHCRGALKTARLMLQHAGGTGPQLAEQLLALESAGLGDAPAGAAVGDPAPSAHVCAACGKAFRSMDHLLRHCSKRAQPREGPPAGGGPAPGPGRTHSEEDRQAHVKFLQHLRAAGHEVPGDAAELEELESSRLRRELEAARAELADSRRREEEARARLEAREGELLARVKELEEAPQSSGGLFGLGRRKGPAAGAEEGAEEGSEAGAEDGAEAEAEAAPEPPKPKKGGLFSFASSARADGADEDDGISGGGGGAFGAMGLMRKMGLAGSDASSSPAAGASSGGGGDEDGFALDLSDGLEAAARRGEGFPSASQLLRDLEDRVAALPLPDGPSAVSETSASAEPELQAVFEGIRRGAARQVEERGDRAAADDGGGRLPSPRETGAAPEAPLTPTRLRWKASAAEVDAARRYARARNPAAEMGLVEAASSAGSEGSSWSRLEPWFSVDSAALRQETGRLREAYGAEEER